MSKSFDMARSRLALTGLVFAAAFAAVAIRLVDVSVLPGMGEPRVAAAASSAVNAAGRGDILDRNGLLLATTLPSASLYADPAMVLDPATAASRLVEVLPGLNRERLVEQLSGDRRFVWLHRNLSPTQQHEINRLGLPGIGFMDEQRRYHPAGRLTAHLVGFTDIDGQGLAGIEASFDNQLDEAGAAVAMSIDLRLQELMREELLASIEQFSAIGGAGLIMDAQTSEILAMVSLPDFEPAEAGTADDETRFNRATLGAYEMGSTFKIFNTAIALETGAASMTSRYDASRPLRYGRFTISDYHGQGRTLTVPEIFVHSSNIGSALMSRDIGIERQRDYLGRLGLLQAPPVEIGEVARPIVPDPWREINAATISFGHGLAVSPLALVSAVATTINGGIYRPPTLLRRDEGAVEGVRVFSEATSDAMRRMMRAVVEDGTGRNADAPGYFVGGKTGTADKPQGRGYSSNARLSSFVAAFPMHDPEYVVLVMLDEPQGTRETYGYATGGWVAAPAIRRIVERMGPMVGMMPANPDDPAINERLRLDRATGGSRVITVQH